VQKARRRDDEGGEQQRLAAGELHCSITLADARKITLSDDSR
jgi:hypothetical protein